MDKLVHTQNLAAVQWLITGIEQALTASMGWSSQVFVAALRSFFGSNSFKMSRCFSVIAASQLHGQKLTGQCLLEHVHLVTQPVTLLAQLQPPLMCSNAEIFFVKPNGKKTKA